MWGPRVPGAALPALGGLTAPSLYGMSTSLAAVPQVPWPGGHDFKVRGLSVDYPRSSTFRRWKLREVVDSMLHAPHVLTE